MTSATTFVDAQRRVTRILVASNDVPNPRDGFVGWIAEGWNGDATTGHPVWWVKISDSQWGDPVAAPPGPAGPTGPPGPAGGTGPHAPGGRYAADQLVVVGRTLWQCRSDHTAATDGDGGRTPFEVDAVAGLWGPLAAEPVRSVAPFLAGAAAPVGEPGTVTHLYLRQSGTGVVTRFRIGVIGAAGEVAVGVQRADAAGAAGPGDTLAWWSGLTPAVAATPERPAQEFAVAGGIVVYAGDFLVLSVTDPAATFLAVDAGPGTTFAPLSEGETHVLRVDPADAAPPPDARDAAAASGPRPLVVGLG